MRLKIAREPKELSAAKRSLPIGIPIVSTEFLDKTISTSYGNFVKESGMLSCPDSGTPINERFLIQGEFMDLFHF